MKIYDLSFHLSVEDMVFPGTPSMDYVRTQSIANDHYNLGLMKVNTHAGTHTDAPLHFVDGGDSLDKVDISKYVGKAVVVDCTSKGAFDKIDIDDAAPYEKQIEECRRVIFKTGWSKNYNKKEFFTDYPVLTLELAEWLVQKKIVMVGVEPPSLNPGLYIEVHKAFLANGVAIVEGLTNLESLPSDEIFFIGAPIGFVGADGFPIRAFAIDLNAPEAGA